MKVEASRDRARVTAKFRKWALEAVMGSKKAALAHLKGLETLNTPALLGEDRRDGEKLFDFDASVQLRADENYRDCTKPSTPVAPKPQRLSMLALPSRTGPWPAPSLSCATRGGSALTIGRLLSSRPCLMWQSRAFIVSQIDDRPTIPLQCLTNLICLLPNPGGGESPIVLQFLLHVLWSSCHADSIHSWDARACFWDSAIRGCSALQFAIRRRLLQEVGRLVRIHGISVLRFSKVL